MEQAIMADSSGMDTHNYYVLHSVKAHRQQIGTYMLSLQLWRGTALWRWNHHLPPHYKDPRKKTVYL